MSSRPFKPKPLAAACFHKQDQRHECTAVKRSAASDLLLASNKRQQRPPSPPPVPSYASRTFPTQQHAFSYWDAHPQRQQLRCYAVELSATGQRHFLVCTPQQLWEDYCQLLPAQRCHYEIIREGSPCHLYLDVEFAREANPQVAGSRLVQLLVAEMGRQLRLLFDIHLQPQHVLELDSSTSTKFSRHLIVHLPGLAWADNGHAGRFVLLVVLALLRRAQYSTAAAAAACVRTKDGGWTTPVDMGVYSRNRAFRLYLSTKFGRSSWLRCTPRYGGVLLTPSDTFQRSLITAAAPPAVVSCTSSGGHPPYPPYHAPQQQQQDLSSHLHISSSTSVAPTLTSAAAAPAADPGPPVMQQLSCGRSTSQTPAAAAPDPWWLPAASSMTCPMGRPCPLSLLHMPPVDWQQLLQELPEQHASLTMLHQPSLMGATGCHPWPNATSPCAPQQQQWQQCGYGMHAGHATSSSSGSFDWGPVVIGPSPFPGVEQLLRHACEQRGAPASVRSWGAATGAGLLLFNMRGGRWCGNVGRQHRSNGIYFVVDVNAGIWYQKCYDPECRNYRSETLPLPQDVWGSCQAVVWQQQKQQGLPPMQQEPQELHGCGYEHPHLKPEQNHHCQQQQQQQLGLHHQAQQGAAGQGLEDDDELLQLLAQVEQERSRKA